MGSPSDQAALALITYSMVCGSVLVTVAESRSSSSMTRPPPGPAKKNVSGRTSFSTMVFFTEFEAARPLL